MAYVYPLRRYGVLTMIIQMLTLFSVFEASLFQCSNCAAYNQNVGYQARRSVCLFLACCKMTCSADQPAFELPRNQCIRSESSRNGKMSNIPNSFLVQKENLFFLRREAKNIYTIVCSNLGFVQSNSVRICLKMGFICYM